MKRLLKLSAVALSLAAASPAAAYDPPGYNWTGLYLGGHVGGGWLNADANLFGDPTRCSNSSPAGSAYGSGSDTVVIRSARRRVSRWITGGYNQLFDRLLLGIEGDFSWGSQEDSGSATTDLPFVTGLVPLRTDVRSELDWLATLRGRIGALVTPRLLFYGTAGVAFGEVHQKLVLSTGPSPNISEIFIGGFNESLRLYRALSVPERFILGYGSGLDGWRRI